MFTNHWQYPIPCTVAALGNVTAESEFELREDLVRHDVGGRMFEIVLWSSLRYGGWSI